MERQRCRLRRAQKILEQKALNYLLDTNILIDALRSRHSAIELLKGLEGEKCISVISVAEIFAGIRSDQQRNTARTLIEALKTIPVDSLIAELAGDFIRQYAASHSVLLADAAIAATAYLNRLELITLNRKHFPMFSELRKPY